MKNNDASNIKLASHYWIEIESSETEILPLNALVIDAITLGEGRRDLTRDFIGAGPRMVAATIRARNHQVQLVRGEDFLRDNGGMASTFDACFISGMTMDRPSIVAIARAWKKANGGKPVIVGGPAALEPGMLLRMPDIDAAVPGEAEQILFGALAGEDMPNFAISLPSGFITRSNVASVQDVRFTGENWPDLAFIEQKIPPSIDLLAKYDNYWAARVYVECVRGCSNYTRSRIGPGGNQACKDCGHCDTGNEFRVDFPCVANIKPGCGFCSTAAISGPVRSFGEAYIVDQVGNCIDLGCHRIVLGGSDFLEYQREKLIPKGCSRPGIPPPPNHDVLHSLVTRLVDFGPVRRGDVQLFVENIKASLCDDEALRTLAMIPGISVSIGVETGSDEHLKQIGKATTVATIKQAVALLKKYRIRYHAYFIHSLPGQTPQTVKESIDLMRWLEGEGAEKITIYRFKPLPGTAFEHHRVAKKFLDDAEPEVQEAMRINEAGKEKYLNKAYKVLIAEQDFRDKSAAIAYILQGGPKVKLPKCKHLVNDKKVHVARITRVISDKVVEGALVE
nr:radical SAM protein [Candidatus Sigynarchaeota archaeon]